MNCKIRKWELLDAKDLAVALSNTKIQDNLRDGLPYPYTEQDGIDYISAMLSSDENDTFAFAITVEGKVIGSIGVFRQGNIHRQTAEVGCYIAEEYWGKAGADFKRQFTYDTYMEFIKEAGYENVEYSLVEGKIPCAVAVITK